MGHGPFPKIEPHQVGAFGPDRTNGRHAVAQKVEHVVHVSVQIVDQLLEPLVAPTVSRFQRNGSEYVALIGMQLGQLGLQTPAERVRPC